MILQLPTYAKLCDFDGTMISIRLAVLWGQAIEALWDDNPEERPVVLVLFFLLILPSSTYTKLKDFDNTNGANPYGSLMQASDGKLYGMTSYGGSGSYGVIFSYDPSSSTYTKLMDFDGTNGAFHMAA